jgi:hypothetical protein
MILGMVPPSPSLFYLLPGFLASWLPGFLASWLPGFLASWLLARRLASLPNKGALYMSCSLALLACNNPKEEGKEKKKRKKWNRCFGCFFAVLLSRSSKEVFRSRCSPKQTWWGEGRLLETFFSHRNLASHWGVGLLYWCLPSNPTTTTEGDPLERAGEVKYYCLSQFPRIHLLQKWTAAARRYLRT